MLFTRHKKRGQDKETQEEFDDKMRIFQLKVTPRELMLFI